MNRTKIIYFLSAFVLILGCYALNSSYSYFVQTETINDVSSSVPTLSYTIGYNELTIETINILANTEELIKVKVNNNGVSDIKYVLSLIEKVEGVEVQLVKLDGNNIIGNLSNLNSKYVWFYVKNNNNEDKEIKFSLTGTYYTLKLDEESILSNSNIDLNNLYIPSIKDSIIINSINSSVDKTMLNNTLYIDNVQNIDENNTRGLLLSIEDNYTALNNNMSYYYNGNVIDNYVNFANMCFRIVRIESDNSIKLILEDRDNICEESNGNYALVINDFIEENNNEENLNDKEKVIYSGTYGYVVNQNDQIILDYLNPSSVNEYNGLGLVSDYSMVNVFKNFQTKLSDYLSYMKINKVCIENTLYEDDLGNVVVSDLNSNYANWTKMYYKTYVDIKNSVTNLNCDGTYINKYSDGTDMYVSTLTAEEIILAGINDNNEMTSNYLMSDYSLEKDENDNKYSGINFWTLSPSYFDGLRSYAYRVNSKGMLESKDLLDTNTVFRPTIIINDTKLISGNGTKINPYVINESIN